MLGYNPGNVEHGYLWWLAWLDHNARTLFSVQDANGVFRPLFLQASCATYAQLIDNLNTSRPASGSEFEGVLNLTPIIGANGLCPKQAAAQPGRLQAVPGPASRGRRRVAHVGSSGRSSGNVSALTAFDPGPPRHSRSMETGTPSIAKVATMVLFALSCVGLLLFLWLSFGGTIPFNPQGYRFEAAFPDASQLADQADVRIAGRVGGQGDRQAARPAGQPHAGDDPDEQQVRADPQGRPGDPAPEDDPRRDLRAARRRAPRAARCSPTARILPRGNVQTGGPARQDLQRP